MTTTTHSGLVHGLDEMAYHALPGLSSTGAKRILRSPAHYRHEREHRVEKAAFDVGHAVHALVLGVGLDAVRIDAEDWRTKAAKDARAEAYAAGQVPLLAKDADRVRDIADAVLTHPVAGALLTGGAAEVSMFWDDPETGVPCRGRLDYLTPRPVIVDLKTTQDANPAAFGRTALNLGYDVQAAFYSDGHEVITGERAPFLHVLVEVEPPRAVSVVQLDEDALYVGALKARRAIEVYRDCVDADAWPAYLPEIHPVSLPGWALTTAERTYL